MPESPTTFVEAVRWHLFQKTVSDVREDFANVPPEHLQKRIDEAVEAVRAQRYRERAARP
jgi:Ribbon-helix-helix domain